MERAYCVGLWQGLVELVTDSICWTGNTLADQPSICIYYSISPRIAATLALRGSSWNGEHQIDIWASTALSGSDICCVGARCTWGACCLAALALKQTLHPVSQSQWQSSMAKQYYTWTSAPPLEQAFWSRAKSPSMGIVIGAAATLRPLSSVTSSLSRKFTTPELAWSQALHELWSKTPGVLIKPGEHGVHDWTLLFVTDIPRASIPKPGTAPPVQKMWFITAY